MRKFLVSCVSGLTKQALKLQFWLCKPGLDSEGISLNSFFPPLCYPFIYFKLQASSQTTSKTTEGPLWIHPEHKMWFLPGCI